MTESVKRDKPRIYQKNGVWQVEYSKEGGSAGKNADALNFAEYKNWKAQMLAKIEVKLE